MISYLGILIPLDVMCFVKKPQDLKDWTMFLFYGETEESQLFNWNFFLRPTYVKKIQILVTTGRSRERIMLLVIYKMLRSSGGMADREMATIILCDRILIHTARD